MDQKDRLGLGNGDPKFFRTAQISKLGTPIKHSTFYSWEAGNNAWSLDEL